jgi:hypothetical protein
MQKRIIDIQEDHNMIMGGTGEAVGGSEHGEEDRFFNPIMEERKSIDNKRKVSMNSASNNSPLLQVRQKLY